MTQCAILGVVIPDYRWEKRVATEKRKSIKWALKRRRLLRSVKLTITPRAVRLATAFEKADKKRAS
jgi:hypothetical protein